MTTMNGHEFETTIYDSLLAAENISIPAIRKVFNDQFAKVQDNPVHLAELATACNFRAWYWHDELDPDLCTLYTDLYEKVQDTAYNGKRSKEFVRKYWELMD